MVVSRFVFLNSADFPREYRLAAVQVRAERL